MWEGSKYPPREWQRNALPVIIDHLKKGRKTIVSAIMGAGKSILIAELVREAMKNLKEDRHIIVTAPRQNLVGQLAATIAERVGEDKVGKYYTHEKCIDRPVIVACNASCKSLSPNVKGRVAILIGDEVHSTESDTFKEAFDILAPFCAVGFTATPFRSNDKQSLSLWDDVAYRYTAADALRDKVIVPWELVHWDGKGAKNARQINVICAHMIKKHCSGPGLINAKDIDDAEETAHEMRERGFKAMAIHSKLSKQMQSTYIRRLKEGEYDMLVHVNLLTEGVDLPWLQWLCLRRPVAARVRFVQEVGRVLRSYPNKTQATILDPYDLFGMHGLIYPEALGRILTKDDMTEDEEELASLKLEPSERENIRRMKPAVAFQRIDSWIHSILTTMRAYNLAKPPEPWKDTWRGGRPSHKMIVTCKNLKWLTRYLPEEGGVRGDFKMAIDRCERLKNGAVSDMLTILFALSKLSKPMRERKISWKIFVDSNKQPIELPSLTSPMSGLLFAAKKGKFDFVEYRDKS